jgi:cytochrome o ubiquinol oxidase subunit 2
LTALPLAGCGALKLGVANHAGPIADSQWHLYIIVGIVLIFVGLPVWLLTPLVAWHYRLSNKGGAYKPDWDFSWWLEGLIWLPPLAIVIGLGVVLWNYTLDLDPYRPIPSDQPTLEIQAVALDWKWLFIYPEQHLGVINQLTIPVGRPVHITLTSGTVMQSLLMPQLAGQIYAMAGMRTQLNIAANHPGVFRGENTQYNGDGFQSEKFDVVALPAPDYQSWMARTQNSAEPFDGNSFSQLFRKSTVAKPIFYSATPSDLFEHILARSLESKS